MDYALYRQFTERKIHKLESMVPHSFGPIKFTVRSGHDPLLSATVLTQETMDFGFSSQEFLIIGLILLVIFGAASGIPIYFWVKERQEFIERQQLPRIPGEDKALKYQVQTNEVDKNDMALNTS
jgi:hypothetical protein